MLERGVEVDVVGGLERQLQLDVFERDGLGVAPRLRRSGREPGAQAIRAAGHERVEARLSEIVAEPGQVEHRVAGRNPTRGSSPGRREDAVPAHRSEQPEPEQVVDRLVEAAAAECDEELAPALDVGGRGRRGLASGTRRPRRANAVGSSSDERSLLVAEDRRREQVDEAVLTVLPDGVVQSGRGLERERLLLAGPDRRGEGLHAKAPWAHSAP